jgi:hypothetical protein
MPAFHKIESDLKLITTTWSGEATDSELIDALTKYQQDIKSNPDYCFYNEIVDFSKAVNFKLSTAGLRKLVQIATGSDVKGVKTKLAIIVSEPVAYGLARIYEAYRSLLPNVSKEVSVFKNHYNALEWVSCNPDIDP